MIFTDLCVMEPDSKTKELNVVSLHPGVVREQAIEATGWPIKFAVKVGETPPPTAKELQVLRELYARTKAAHGEAA